MRVVIADNHPLVADALTQYLRAIDPAIEVAATTTVRGAIARLRERSKVRLILLDPQLPDAGGLQGLSLIREAFPLVPVVLLTGTDDVAVMKGALDLGAAGVIPKSYSGTAIVKALELILAGERHVPALLLSAPGLREDDAVYGPNSAQDGRAGVAALSRHERAVLGELAKGLSNAEIGRVLGITPAGVAYHLKSIFKKLGVTSRGRAIALYHELLAPAARA